MPEEVATASSPPLQLGDLLLKDPDGGVSGTGIIVAGDLAAEHAHGVVGAGEGKGGGLIDGGGQGAVVAVPAVAGVDGLGVEMDYVHVNAAHDKNSSRMQVEVYCLV